MIFKKAEKDEPIISGIYLCLSAVAMLICTQCRIYLQWYGMLLTYRWVRNKQMVPTLDHNAPQIVAGHPGKSRK